MINQLSNAIYNKESATSILNDRNNTIKYHENNGEVSIKTISTNGLGNYSRTEGFSKGIATIKWVLHPLTQSIFKQIQCSASCLEEATTMTLEAVAKYTRDYVVPHIDLCVYDQIINKCPMCRISSAKDTLSTIDEIVENPSDYVLYVSTDVYGLLYRNYLSRYLSIRILPKEISDNVNFMIINKDAINTVTLFNSTDHIKKGLDKWVFDYKVFYDVFIINTELIYIQANNQ